MSSVHHSFETTCSPEALWSVIADLSSVAKTNSAVRSVAVVGDKQGGIGAMRRCELRPKGTVTERVCAYDEGRAIGFEIVESDWPVVAMSWVTKVVPRSDGARLDQVLDYKMKFGPIGWLLNVLVMRRALERNIGEALKGVIRVAEGHGQARQ